MPDYPAAIEYWAHPSNTLGPPNTPKGWVLHTPEEPADDYPGTPVYFAQPGKQASTTYFVSYLGFVYQCVPEDVAAIANGVRNKPYPAWASASGGSLNRQTLSVEIEGYARSIGETLSQAQRKALVDLLVYGCIKYGIPPDRAHIIGHYEVADNRSDPGTLPIDAIVAEVAERLEPTGPSGEDEVNIQEYEQTISRVVWALADGEFVQAKEAGDPAIYQVHKRGDVPELLRVDDSRAGMLAARPIKTVPLGVVLYLFHGDQVA